MIRRAIRGLSRRVKEAATILLAPPSSASSRDGVANERESVESRDSEPIGADSQSPPDDSFMRDGVLPWLLFANAGMLERGNLACFEHAVSHRPSEAPFLEIGTFCGLSANLITHYKRKHGAKNPLITVDRWIFEGSAPGVTIGQSGISFDEYREFVKETFRRNAQMFSRDDLPFTIELFSDELFEAWRDNRTVSDVFGRTVKLGGSISFCYIDGNHTYDYAKRDFVHADTFLERGGFVLFDDSADGSAWEVCRVVEEVRVSGRYELVMKNPNYLFRKK